MKSVHPARSDRKRSKRKGDPRYLRIPEGGDFEAGGAELQPEVDCKPVDAPLMLDSDDARTINASGRRMFQDQAEVG